MHPCRESALLSSAEEKGDEAAVRNSAVARGPWVSGGSRSKAPALKPLCDAECAHVPWTQELAAINAPMHI